MGAPDEPLRRVLGDRTAKAFDAAFGIGTVGDLLAHYPRRYYERGELADLRELRVGDEVTVQASVASVSANKIRANLRKIDVIVEGEAGGRLTVTFFNRRDIEPRLRPGTTALFSGKVERYGKRLSLTQPEFEVGEDAAEFAGRLVPIYPASKQLRTWNIAKAMAAVLDTLGELDDPLPGDVRRRHDLADLRTAYEQIHRPATMADVRVARRRLRWDEAFVLQVALARRRAEALATPATPRVARADGLLAAFDARLPFELTAGQQAVSEEIMRDIAQAHPMHRLLQGEVGSGKTVVALRAMLAVVDAGGQAALLAPTEVLAAQHCRSIVGLLGPLAEAGRLGGADNATRVALLTGSQSSAQRREALLEAASGAAGIVVGTHALLQEHVQFAELGLVVVDEQHRFGVHQRDALRAKGATPPHVLVMTATPIPRTVAMTVFGDLETSALTELPRGRSPIQSFVVPGDNASWQSRMWGRVRDEVAAGHQAYVVCPRIGGDDARGGQDDETPEDAEPGIGQDDAEQRRPAAAVVDVVPLLSEGELAGLRVEALHGRLSGEEKDGVMTRFARGEIDVLVATTVIEVGVDVPNATVMVVLDADRFGVSQLHQLRGRVGRGSAAGWCLLHSDAEPGTPARERLDSVAATLDGFELARLDLEQRREGDVLGAAQSGSRSSLRLLRLTRDEDLILAAREEATRLVGDDPSLTGHPALAAQLTAALEPERFEYLEKA